MRSERGDTEMVDRWMQAMRRGDFVRAWEISDETLRSHTGHSAHHLPRHEQWVWDGRPVEGKRVLVRCHHGLGDTVQFVRYAPLLRSVGADPIFWVQPELVPLLRTAPGVDRLLPVDDREPEVEREIEVEVMELPHVFRSTLSSLPATVPYLRVPAADREVAGSLEVGLVWRAGGWDERRSVPFPALAPLLQTAGVSWHVLQRGPGLEDRPPGFGLLTGSDDPLAAAARMRALDLVITVDSFPAHLAGALAVPVWTLLHADPDWRWMRGRDDSPWYPTMRLFRQERPGDWSPLVDRVATRLRDVVKAHARSGVGVMER